MQAPSGACFRFGHAWFRETEAHGIKAENPSICIYRAEGDNLETGLTTLLPPLGVEVPAYDVERCICDMLKLRERGCVDMQLFPSAVTGYFNRKDKDILKL